jgi:hypothetical protein
VLHALSEFVAPFARGAGTEMRYRLTREPGRAVIAGRSRRRDRRGEPRVSTRVVLDGAGIATLEVKRGGRVRRAVRTMGPEADAPRVEPRDAQERSRGSWIGGRA